ncbi:hypothetical protein ACTL6U_00590 [Rhodovibrionaceae bacterium A322]
MPHDNRPASYDPFVPVTPRDAASVIAMREGEDGLEVLMGQRSPEARFMPGVFVFPGGSLSPEDAEASGFEEDLTAPPGDPESKTQTHFAHFARAALRETLEETGTLLAAPGSATDSSTQFPAPVLSPETSVWSAFRAAGVTPAFSSLQLIAEATTPSRLPIRFHSRFFLCRSPLSLQVSKGDGELVSVAWRPLAQLSGLPMADVTEAVLHEARQQFRKSGPGTMRRITYSNSGLRVE